MKTKRVKLVEVLVGKCSLSTSQGDKVPAYAAFYVSEENWAELEVAQALAGNSRFSKTENTLIALVPDTDSPELASGNWFTKLFK